MEEWKRRNQTSEIDVSSFLTLEGEELIAYKKQHWLILVEPIFLIVICTLLSVLGLYLLFVLFGFYPVSLVLLSFLIISISISLITKAVVDWQHHIYIVTTRKILEIWCVPLSSAQVNDVFLDKVRATEVTSKSYSLIHELLNIGDVIISFDHFSKEEVFTLSGISDPKGTSTKIGDALDQLTHGWPIWFPGEGLSHAKQSEDILND